MTDAVSNHSISDPVNLTKTAYAKSGDFQLLCCSAANLRDMWVSAAELVYEFTGNPGTVVKNTISFSLDASERIDLNLLDGSFELYKEDRPTDVKGRKGLELLMKWKGMSYDQAVEYITENYSPDHAKAMSIDYDRMQLLSRRGEGAPE